MAMTFPRAGSWESFKPNTLQEKTEQAVTEEIQNGGLIQKIQPCNCHASSPQAELNLQTCFI